MELGGRKMILLIGTNGCSKCRITKQLLTQKNIEFEYKLLDEFSTEESNRYLNMAEEAEQFSFPLILKDNRIVELKDVV